MTDEDKVAAREFLLHLQRMGARLFMYDAPTKAVRLDGEGWLVDQLAEFRAAGREALR